MLACVALVSSALLWAAVPAQAHEVDPTVADLSVSDGEVTFSLRIMLESYLAGIDLDLVTDTNEATEAEDHDALRAMDPDALRTRFDAFAPRMLSAMRLMADGAPLDLSVATLDIPPVGDVGVARLTRLTFTAQTPDGTRALKLDWPKGYGTLILRQIDVADGYTGYLSGGQSSPDIPLEGTEPQSFGAVLWSYVPVGFDHILPKGLDHILFVLGLFFFSIQLRPLVTQVSAFTLAHTVTLALGALGLVTVPASIVEPLIALSIVYVAVENVFARKLNPWRPAVIFCFGLLHGLGFASVLGEFGLPTDQYFSALIGFTIGVELGQLTVIAVAYLLVGHWFGSKPYFHKVIAVPASLVIAAIGAYWVLERTVL